MPTSSSLMRRVPLFPALRAVIGANLPDNAFRGYFLQPIGVGFSYAENGQTIERAETAAVDVQAFIAIFFETFQEFKGQFL